MKKNNEKFTSLILLIFSAVLITVATIVVVRSAVFAKEGVKTEATITKIVTRDAEGEDGSIDHDVYVEFLVDGEKYEWRLDTCVFTMKEGQKVPIYYMPYNPDEFTYAGQTAIFPIFLYGFGAVALGFALVLPISAVKKRKLWQFKKSAGQIKARITEVEYNEKLSVMGKHRLKIKCADGEGREYSASQLVSNGGNVYVNKEIVVYTGEKGEYKIDLEEACLPDKSERIVKYDEGESPDGDI